MGVDKKKQTGLTGLRRAGIANLSVVLQPILERKAGGFALHAAECLIRGPKGSPLESPAELFAFVRAQKNEARFDATCLEKALEAAGALPASLRVSVNVHASTLCEDDDFAAYVDNLAWGNAVPPGRLTVEISEYGPHTENPALAAAVRELKHLGMRVALDDSGLGDPDFRVFLDLKPDYLKVDRYLVHGLKTEATNRSILEGLFSLSKTLGFRIVAEGVENAEELRLVTDMGITLVQGFLFGQPMRADELRDVLTLGSEKPWERVRAP